MIKLLCNAIAASVESHSELIQSKSVKQSDLPSMKYCECSGFSIALVSESDMINLYGRPSVGAPWSRERLAVRGGAPTEGRPYRANVSFRGSLEGP
jgi:hypothetical protein